MNKLDREIADLEQEWVQLHDKIEARGDGPVMWETDTTTTDERLAWVERRLFRLRDRRDRLDG